MIDWPHFTPWQSLEGGALIGLAAGLLFAVNRKIAGISGIFAHAVLIDRRGLDWRAAFLVGLLLAPWLVHRAQPLALQEISLSRLLFLLAAGVLTGYGTYRARGCTSGHGVCGLARLSWRSMIAVSVFMTSGVITVSILRHVIGGVA